jgi:5-amino-6-(5-phosphoribosylamino)uracil reductase
MMRVFACFAVTLDGKIGSSAYPDDRIGSEADLTHLLTVRNQADTILYGGETFRQYPALRKGNQQTIPPKQCLLTRTFNMPTDAPLFTNAVKQPTPTPILIASPTPPNDEIKAQYPTHLQWFTTKEENPIPTVLGKLRDEGSENVMIEGGGHIFHLALQAQAVHELYLTICPLLLGGNENPMLVTGEGFRVGQAPRTEVLYREWKGDELYLHLKILYPNA